MPILAQLLSDESWIHSPWAWALVLGCATLWCLVPRGRRNRVLVATGVVSGVISVGLLASRMPVIWPWSEATMFWLVSAVTVVSGTAMISMRSPVFSAIWFAMALLGTSCLFLLQGAQLLAVATIVVYAGAIVVMFLFLIMLAQPEGHEFYDRISWASPGALFSCVAGAAIVLMLTTAIVGIGDRRQALRDEIAVLLPEIKVASDESAWTAGDIHSLRIYQNDAEQPVVALVLNRVPTDKQLGQLREQLTKLDVLAARDEDHAIADNQIQISSVDETGTQAEQHVATLGGVLFSRYLVAVEIAGTLLLIALVGAVAIVMFGREQESAARQQAPSPTGGTA